MSGSPSFPVLLLLHGFLGSCDDWDECIQLLGDRFCCVCVDLPGHGRSAKHPRDANDYRMEGVAEALKMGLEAIGLTQMIPIGYSMGGRLALYLTLQWPEMFPAAVIESASPGLRSEVDRQARIRHDRALANALETDFPTFLDHWYQLPLFESLRCHPEFEQIKQRRSRNVPSELAHSLRMMGLGMQPSLWERLAVHRQPLQFIVGERDRKFVGINQEMVALCQTARIAIVPNAGHTVHLETPQAFIRQVGDFLERSVGDRNFQ